MRLLTDLIRLMILGLSLPLILLLAGPLLLLAVIRGRQPAGPLTLDLSRSTSTERMGALILALFLLILVWGGLSWFIYENALRPTMDLAGLPALTATPTGPIEPTLSPTPLPPTATATALSPTATPLPLPPTTTPLPLPPTVTPSPLPPTATPLPLPPTATPSPLPSPAPAETATPAGTPTPTSPASLVDRRAAIAAVQRGNDLLRQAIVEANEANLEKLATYWQEPALPGVQAFAQTLYERYNHPLQVEMEYIQPPTIGRQEANEIVVTSRELWRYGGPTKFNEEAFQFTYTLNRKEGHWVITRYVYHILPTPTATPS